MGVRKNIYCTVCVWLVVIFLPQGINAAQFTVDTTRSELVVQLFKAGIGATFAHDHVVRATKFSGQIFIESTAPSGAQVTVEVDATALVADEPETRRRYGLSAGLSEENRREVQNTLESEEQLDVRRYPVIRFSSTRITPDTEGRYNVTGDLELRGVKQVFSLVLEADIEGPRLRGKGSGKFLQSNFGYRPYSAFLGAVRNRDEVILHVDIIAVAQ